MVETIQLDGYTILDHNEDELDLLEKQWHELERGADMTAFQSFYWYQQLQAVYRKEWAKNIFRTHRYILILKDEKPVLIAPLELKKFGIGYRSYGTAPRGIYFSGRTGGFTDYLNFIYDDFDPSALDALISYVTSRYRRHSICFDRMIETTKSYRHLCNRYAVQKRPVPCAALVFPEDFETYRTSLSKSTRQNIRTAVNRTKKNGLQLTHSMIHDEDETVKQQLMDLCRQREQKKNSNSRKQMSFVGAVYCFVAQIFRRAFDVPLDVLHVSKDTFTFMVKDGDRIVSFFWGIRNDHLREYYVILVGVDREYEWYSPNISHLYLFIEEYFSQDRDDIRLLDFTRGAEGYKKTIGCTTRLVSSLRFRVK